jgi:hypothetical protein
MKRSGPVGQADYGYCANALLFDNRDAQIDDAVAKGLDHQVQADQSGADKLGAQCRRDDP